MDAARIAELRGLCEAATPGPWRWREDHLLSEVCPVAVPVTIGDNPAPCISVWPFDEQFIATARTALPEALDEIERLRARCERLRGELDWVRQTVHRAHHDSTLAACEVNTCASARYVLENPDQVPDVERSGG